MSECIYFSQDWNEAPWCDKWHKYMDKGCGKCKPVKCADVVEVSKILKTADEQERQGFIQTAKVLRELVSND